jgi:site-specific DNA recombinase
VLLQLKESIRKTRPSKRPKLILFWSVSRVGRAGAAHISFMMELKRDYGVIIYCVSDGYSTHDDRAEYAISTALLHAQWENINRSDAITPGIKNYVQRGYHLGRAPRGYYKKGPLVVNPEHVQAKQEVLLNDEGRALKEAFKMKIHDGATDREIINFMARKGFSIPPQTLCKMWKNPFYAGIYKNKHILDPNAKGPWEPIITLKEYELLQGRLDGSFLAGVPKFKGKEATPLIPQFLRCDECSHNMTSYFNKKTQSYYYKCNSCNKTANADTSPKSLRPGIHERFRGLLDGFHLDPKLFDVFKLQLGKSLDQCIGRFESARNEVMEEIQLKTSHLERIEHNFVIGEITKAMYEKHTHAIISELSGLQEKLESVPSKKSNQEIMDAKLMEVLKNPRQFYDSLNGKQKRSFQKLIFPEGLRYSMKKQEYLTSEMHLLFDITDCFIESWESNKNKTQRQNAFESRLVELVGIEPTSRQGNDKLSTCLFCHWFSSKG